MIQIDPWQEEVLQTRGDILLCTGRRVGKTYIMARKAVDRMVEKRTPVIVVSLTEDQAELIIAMAYRYAREKYPKLLGRGRNKPTLKTLTVNGSKMISRPVGTTGDSARGFEGGILIVDEASRMPRLFWIAAKPIILTTAGELWLCSTPFGKKGYFYTSFNEGYILKLPEARFTCFYKTTEDVMFNRPINESWTQEQHDGAVKILKEDKREMTILEYGQEYLAQFFDDIAQFLSAELIKSAMFIKRGQQRTINADPFLGADIGDEGGDPTVLISVDRINNEKVMMFDMEILNVKLTETARRIQDEDRQNKYKRLYLDDGGVGLGVVQILHEDTHLKDRVEGVNNSRREVDGKGNRTQRLMKEALYLNLKVMMEQGKIALFDEPEIFESLRTIQVDTSNGKYRIFARNGHIAEALVRAIYCIKDKHLNIWASSKSKPW